MLPKQNVVRIFVAHIRISKQKMIKNLLLVGAGGALGSIARYAVSMLFAYLAISGHWATLLVNIVGSFLIGLAIPLLSGGAHLFAVVGFCGGFTTFSTFSSQALQLFQAGERLTAAVYVAVSLVVSIAMVLLGMYVAGRFVK
jgi:CrcB protein